MATKFCMNCGQPLVPGAQFCLSCGTPVAPAAAGPGAAPAAPTFSAPPAPSGPPPMAGGAPPAPAGPPLSTQLGIQNTTKFLLQHVLLGHKHSYRVLDHEKRHLFTVGENVREEREQAWSHLLHPTMSAQPGLHVGWGAGSYPAASFWLVDDLQGNVRGTLSLQIGGGTSICTLADATGVPILTVNITRGAMSMTAAATSSDGRPMLEARGNLFHHNFSIHDSSGIEVAKIHEAWASVRDTYNLDLLSPVDPLTAIVFALLIDHYKGK